jgi:hypothetical protein
MSWEEDTEWTIQEDKGLCLFVCTVSAFPSSLTRVAGSVVLLPNGFLPDEITERYRCVNLLDHSQGQLCFIYTRSCKVFCRPFESGQTKEILRYISFRLNISPMIVVLACVSYLSRSAGPFETLPFLLRPCC